MSGWLRTHHPKFTKPPLIRSSLVLLMLWSLHSTLKAEVVERILEKSVERARGVQRPRHRNQEVAYHVVDENLLA